MARYLRGAAIGMPVEVLERIRATSPSLLREALLGAISLTPKQEQVGFAHIKQAVLTIFLLLSKRL